MGNSTRRRFRHKCNNESFTIRSIEIDDLLCAHRGKQVFVTKEYFINSFTTTINKYTTTEKYRNGTSFTSIITVRFRTGTCTSIYFIFSLLSVQLRGSARTFCSSSLTGNRFTERAYFQQLTTEKIDFQTDTSGSNYLGKNQNLCESVITDGCQGLAIPYQF